MSLDLDSNFSEFNFKVDKSRNNTIYRFDDFRLDAAHFMLYRGEEEISLPPKAVETLFVLVERAGEIVNKDDLISAIWTDSIVEESNLAHYLHVLRKVLGNRQDGNPFIETLRRRGYRFNGEVSVEEVAPTAKPLPLRSLSTARADNIYLLDNWRRDHDIEPVAPQLAKTNTSWKMWAAAATILICVAGLSVGDYVLSTGTRTNVGTKEIPFRGKDITRLTTTGKSKQAAISPDGNYVAHITADADGDSLWVRQTAAANDIRLAGPSKSEYVSATFSPDGKFVYYAAIDRDEGESELYRVLALGGPSVKVVHDTGAVGISPAGDRIAFARYDKDQTHLLTANIDGTNERIIASLRQPEYFLVIWNSPTWSADGGKIIYPAHLRDESGHYETLLSIDAETGASQTLTKTRWQSVGQPRWSNDGVLFTAAETSVSPQQIWHLSLTDGTATRVTHDLNTYGELTLSSDGSKLAAVQEQALSSIWITGTSDPTDSKLISSEVGQLIDLVWYAEDRIAYTSSAGGTSDVWTMKADGGDIRQITTGANVSLGLSVTPDGKRIVFAAEQNGSSNIWRVDADGSNLTQLTGGNGEYFPQCKPDGRWLIYQSGVYEPTLWKIPIDGGDSGAVSTTRAARPSVSPDGKFVAYHYLDSSFERSRWSIGVTDLETGKQVKRFDLPSTVTERMVRFTRDGKSVAFINSPNGVPNIWLQNLDGSLPKPITALRSDSIFSFNWNPDGNRLAIVRGVETSDVVLIDR